MGTIALIKYIQEAFFFFLLKEICSCSSAGAAEGEKKSAFWAVLMIDFLPIKGQTHADGFGILKCL